MDGQALGVDNGLPLYAYAEALQIHESWYSVAAAGRDDMDGGGHHREDGIHLVQRDSVFGNEMLLAEAHILSFGFPLARLGYRKAEACRDSCAR